MKHVAYKYVDSFGTHYTDDEREVLDSPGLKEWWRLYESDATDLVDLYIRPLDDHMILIGSLQDPDEWGAFSKAAVNAVIRKFYDENWGES